MYFKLASKEHVHLIKTWLKQEHVSKYFYGEGLENTIQDLEKFTTSKKSLWTHYLAYDQEIPFAYLMTSFISPSDKPYSKYLETTTKAITLDLFIGDINYLGKGLSHSMIKQFLVQNFSFVTDVFIDPEKANTKAIHVYEKTGFKKLETFVPTYNPVPHVLMQLKIQYLK